MRAIGIDIGTTTISAVVAESDSRRVEKSFTISNGSFIETENPWEKLQDPAVILRKSEELLEDILKEYPDIGVIGLTGQMHGVVYTDRKGRHVSPLYTWQDGRGNIPCGAGRSVCGMLEETYGVKLYTGYGMATHIYNSMTGLVPETAVSLCTIADYLGMVLTERNSPLLHAGNAAGLGLYDVRKCRFQKEVFDNLHLDCGMLPEVTDEFRILGNCRGIPVCVATGDNQASFFGSVRNVRNSILVNMGTGGQVSVYSEKYFAAEGVETRPFIKDSCILCGSSLCGGRAYALLADFFRQTGKAMGAEDVDPYRMMEHLLETEEEGQERLNVDTRFSGTRDCPELKGSIGNIGTDNFTPGALTRGVLEGMADELYQMYLKMEKGIAGEKKTMIASGNGLRRNRHLQEIMAERFSMRLELAEQKEEAAYGAALAGMVAAGAYQPEFLPVR